ncbi:MAG: 50S ribosomal protein L24 [Spirochaetaceae bacterium]|jgi:large subunit ribosomal protein L24|nr:50S ribosomal protein L24 [Spirochaetaceae bacterium]
MSVQTGTHKFKIKKDDMVEVITGKDKGKRGRILRIMREKDRVVIDGLNLVKKTQRRRNQNDKGGIIEIEAALHSSNVMIVCKKCGPTRAAYEVEGTAKKRICRKCGEAL